MRLSQVHAAPSTSIVLRNRDQVGYTDQPRCGQVGDTLGTDQRRKVTCRRCRKLMKGSAA